MFCCWSGSLSIKLLLRDVQGLTSCLEWTGPDQNWALRLRPPLVEGFRFSWGRPRLFPSRRSAASPQSAEVSQPGWRFCYSSGSLWFCWPASVSHLWPLIKPQSTEHNQSHVLSDVAANIFSFWFSLVKNLKVEILLQHLNKYWVISGSFQVKFVKINYILATL